MPNACLNVSVTTRVCSIINRAVTLLRKLLKSSMKSLILLIALFTLAIHPQKALANRYDDEIAAEKAGERLANIINAEEEAGREAAKQRYEKDHPSSSSGGNPIALLVMLTPGLISGVHLILKPMYGEFICVLEFQRNGTPHFHLLVRCPGDIRTGFNWTH